MINKSRTRWIAMTLSLALLGNTLAFANPEFPNYFGELMVGSDGKPDPSPDREKAAEAKIEAALASVMRRLQIPHVGTDGTIQTDGFFQKLQTQASAIDPEAKIYIAGGVVRSLLGYIYKKIYNTKQKDPSQSTIAILDRIIAGKDKKDPTKDKEILSLEALGIGSDLDILIETAPEKGARNRELSATLTDFINSAESKTGLRDMQSKFKYALVPVGDVKDYNKQMERTLSQGGSTLDWLAFPVNPGGSPQAKMKLPPGYPEIFKGLIQGHYDYLAPKDQSKLEDPDKQTVRGLRPLLELPFLSPSDTGHAQLKKELDVLVAKAKRGENLSPMAYEQFGKMIRNARFEGAHNRFYSFDLLAGVNDACRTRGLESHGREIEKLSQQLSQAARKDGKNLPLIPEFLMNRDPKKREASKDACGLKAAGLLIEEDDFIKNYTDQGVLYHGTPQVENILAVIRSGLIVSSGQQGTAAYGRGFYTSKIRSDAAHCSSGNGSVLSLPVKRGVNLRVLNLQEKANDKILLELKTKAVTAGRDFHQYVAENCDVDILVNTYPLIQNTGAVELPKNVSDLIRAAYSPRIALGIELLKTEGPTADNLIKAVPPLQEWEPLRSLGEQLHLKDVPQTSFKDEAAFQQKSFQILLLRALTDRGAENAAWLLRELKPTYPEVQSELVQKQMELVKAIPLALSPGGGGSGAAAAATSLLRTLKPTHREVQQELIKALSGSGAIYAAEVLGDLEVKDPELQRELIQFQKEAVRDLAIKKAAYKDYDRILEKLKPTFFETDVEMQKELVKALSLRAGNYASRVLRRVKPTFFETDVEMQKELLKALGTRDGTEYAAEVLREVRPINPEIQNELIEKQKDLFRHLSNHDSSINALRILKPTFFETDVAMQEQLVNLVIHHQRDDTGSFALEILRELKSIDPHLQRRMVSMLPDMYGVNCAEVLREINLTDPVAQRELVQAQIALVNDLSDSKTHGDMKTPPTYELDLKRAYRARIPEILQRLKPTDPEVLSRIAQVYRTADPTVQPVLAEILHQGVSTPAGRAHFREILQKKGHSSDSAACRAIDQLKPEQSQEDFLKTLNAVLDHLK